MMLAEMTETASMLMYVNPCWNLNYDSLLWLNIKDFGTSVVHDGLSLSNIHAFPNFSNLGQFDKISELQCRSVDWLH